MDAQYKKKQEELELKKKKEEEKKVEVEEAAYAEIESDHHGRIFIDYRQPRPNVFPQTYKFTKEVKCGVGTFATVWMCTL